jgi:CheY-like chemotaxis protein
VTRDELRAAVARSISPAASPEAAPASTNSKLTTRPLRVLVAEDTPANQKLIQTILTRRGHHVQIVANGQDAVAAVQATPYDIVLMDIQMPVMGGLEAAEAIRLIPMAAGQARVPIVALTAHAMRGDERRCLEAGMDAYVAKPIDTRKLIDLIEAMGRTTPVDLTSV